MRGRLEWRQRTMKIGTGTTEMLLELTTTHRPATDLAFLLHKNPARAQSFDLAFGRVHVGVVRGALDRAGFWEKLKTDWVCFDCELMPWSAKAQELIRQQYAAVGAAASAALPEAVDALQAAARRDIEVATLLEWYQRRHDFIARFVKSYRQYCWPVETVKDLKLA